MTIEHAELSRTALAHDLHPLPQDELRTQGPHPQCRWDPHPLPTGEHPEYGILYTAGDLLTYVVEVFVNTRVVGTRSNIPLLQIQETTHPLRLLDLTSTWVLHNSASVSLDNTLHSAHWAWARATQIQLPDVDNLHARSTVTEGGMTVLLSPTRSGLPALPWGIAPLADTAFYALLKTLTPDIDYEIVRAYPDTTCDLGRAGAPPGGLVGHAPL